MGQKLSAEAKKLRKERMAKKKYDKSVKYATICYLVGVHREDILNNVLRMIIDLEPGKCLIFNYELMHTSKKESHFVQVIYVANDNRVIIQQVHKEVFNEKL